MVLLYAPSYEPTSPPVGQPWMACQQYWHGWDGTEWDLSHGTSGLALQAGTRGLEEPPIIHYRSTSAAVAGSWWRGFSVDNRECLWLLKVHSDGGSQEWVALNRTFRRTLHPGKTGQWVVVDPEGSRRTLTCRFTGLQDDTWDIDPSLVGDYIYGFQLTAEKPFWMGEPIQRRFENAAAGENYFGGNTGGGFGPPYYVSPAATTATATLTNPGDVDVWPVITIEGPCTAASVNGLTFPIALDAGQWVRIDTDPTDQAAIDHTGADRTSELTGWENIAEIPEGETVPVAVTMTGTGAVVVTLTPAYLRAL